MGARERAPSGPHSFWLFSQTDCKSGEGERDLNTSCPIPRRWERVGMGARASRRAADIIPQWELIWVAVSTSGRHDD